MGRWAGGWKDVLSLVDPFFVFLRLGVLPAVRVARGGGAEEEVGGRTVGGWVGGVGAPGLGEVVEGFVEPDFEEFGGVDVQPEVQDHEVGSVVFLLGGGGLGGKVGGWVGWILWIGGMHHMVILS